MGHWSQGWVSFGHLCHRYDMAVIESTPVLCFFWWESVWFRTKVIHEISISNIQIMFQKKNGNRQDIVPFCCVNFPPFMTCRECKSRRKDKQKWIPTCAWNDIARQHAAYLIMYKRHSRFERSTKQSTKSTLPCRAINHQLSSLHRKLSADPSKPGIRSLSYIYIYIWNIGCLRKDYHKGLALYNNQPKSKPQKTSLSNNAIGFFVPKAPTKKKGTTRKHMTIIALWIQIFLLRFPL